MIGNQFLEVPTTYSTKINGKECYGIVEISTNTLYVATRNTIIQEGIVTLGVGYRMVHGMGKMSLSYHQV